jgi:hypothetical protein
MSQTIQIKRSASSNVPSATLVEGELAYGHEGTDAGKLVIGRPLDSNETASNDVIGGKYFVDIINNATNSNTANKLVKRNASGNFSAGTITASLNGNANTATALAATANIHGVAFDGSGDIDLSEQIQDTVGAMFSSNSENGIAVTYEDSDGTIDLAVGTLNQDTTGNANTASALETPVTIQGVSFDGSGDITLTEEIQDVIGGMVAGNDESGISVTYQDADGTLDFAVSGNLNQNTTGSAGSLASGITLNGTVVNAGSNLTLDADDIDEVAISPTNKYFTNARADARVQTLLNHANHSNITASVDAGTGQVRLTAASQYDDSDARESLSLHADSSSNVGSSLAYDNSTGKFTYTAPTTSAVRSAVITSAGNTGTGYGSLSYDNATGVLSFAKVTSANIKTAVQTTGLTGLNLSNSSSASNLTFEGVSSSNTRTLTLSGGGNSNEFSLKTQANNQAGASGNFTVLSTDAVDSTGDSDTNTIGIGQTAPTAVDQYNNRVHIGPNTQFNGNVTLDGTSLFGASSLGVNGSSSDTDSSLYFKEGNVVSFKLAHNHADDTLSIMQGNSTPVITIPNSGNNNPNITVARNTDFTGHVVVSGDLTVNGGTTTITSTELSVGDNIITLNDDHNDSTASVENCGIAVNRGKLTNDATTDRALANFYFDASTLEWNVQNPSAADGVGTETPTAVLTVSNIESKTFTINGGTF